MIFLSFEVIASKRVKKEIEKFEKPLKIKLLDLFLKLKENPMPPLMNLML